MRRGLVGVVLAGTVLAGCSSGAEDEAGPEAPAPTSTTASSAPPGEEAPTPDPTAPSETPTEEPEPLAPPVSVLGLSQQEHRGDRLRLGAVREETAAFTSYDVSYRSRSTTPQGETEAYTITGVLNVPKGRGPFPAVVLAHGYIDPDVYVRGQGMTRERGYLADRGYVALHVDYRNHAESDDDPDFQLDMRLGYSADVINAVKALRASKDVPVADDRVALFGRSMGGGVVLKSLVAAPGLVQAAAPWASVSSLEAQNFEQFQRDDAADSADTAALRERHGLPEDNPAFWRRNSSRPYVDRITEPVLMVHGRFDDTCPPPWATATTAALEEAGVDVRLAEYDDGHAFGPAFFEAMDRTIRFFRAQGV
ncbi:prolyl oligopeptidase family serine peptidase [Nocardioides litoris]|uniref:prolyl oligopeptidase family serine peptidase n=1 Tax=Nocardioides litoris TaxID=1926648 RepID=UPI00111F5792|nr:prolyl oligopeptidase family serine peptidase [Nocardioides litoris]